MNRELVRIFNEIALILELEEVQWEPRAYRNAANSIENLSKDVKEIYEEGCRDALEEISGIGESISESIEEHIKNGKMKKYEKLKKKYPKEITKLVNLEGLGAKKVKKLIKELDIKSKKDLEKAAKNHKIRGIEGFGKVTEENLLQSLKTQKIRENRYLLNEILPVAEEIIGYLKKYSNKINYAGSLRRMKETIGDIDILVTSDEPKKVMEKFVNMDEVKRVLSKGKTRTSLVLEEQGMQVDLRVVDKKEYGAALMYFTGSKQHNVALRKEAIKQGYSLSEYGLEKKETGRKARAKTEKEIYKKLGYSYIPPEMRENRGELELAKKNKTPELVTLEDIKGDLQMHTNHSDGNNSVEEMAKAAKKLGYEYIAITDHSPSSRIASGLEKKELKKLWKEIDSVEKIKILKGSEVDIQKNGKLDYKNDVLEKLDLVIVSVHSNFKMGKKEMTNRLLKALDNEFVNILAHPTGRQIGKRKGYDADWEKVFEKAKENNVALEINASPERLDLNDDLIFKAREIGNKFAINTDAHSAHSLDNIKFGIGQARRGWLEKNKVINTFSLKKLKKFLE